MATRIIDVRPPLLALLCSVLAFAASAGERKVAIILARGPGANADATKGVALKLGIEAQRRGLAQVVPPGNLAGILPAEDDPFLVDCAADDECMLNLAATVGQPVILLAILDRPAGHRRATIVFVDAQARLLLHRARNLSEPFNRSLEAEAMKALEAGLPLEHAAAGPGEESPLKTARLWKRKCAMCHGVDGKAQTEMGLKLRVHNMADAAWQKGQDDAQMKKQILEGSDSHRLHQTDMRSYAEKLKPAEVEALARYIRGFRP